MTNLSIITPIKYGNAPTSLRQKLTELADAYFYLGGRVAIVMPEHSKKGNEAVQLREGQAPTWEIALKGFSYISSYIWLSIPLTAAIRGERNPLLHVVKSLQWRAALTGIACIPPLLFIAKAVLRTAYSYNVHSRLLPDGTQVSGSFFDEMLRKGERILRDGTKEVGTFYEDKLTEGRRRLPNGTEEIGSFFANRLNSGMSFLFKEGEQITSEKPEPLLGELEIPWENIELNFIEVTINGRPEIIPIQRPCKASHDIPYIRYPGSPYDALLKVGQDSNSDSCGRSGNRCYDSPVKFILLHINNHLLNIQEFFRFLKTPNAGGRLPIHTINKNNILGILQLALANHIPIDLQKVDPLTEETLFTQWADSEDVELIKALLTLDPTAIQQTSEREESYFAEAVLKGYTEKAKLLLGAMQGQRMELSFEDKWILKAFSNDCNFTNDECLQLPLPLRHKLFQTANIHLRIEFLQKLRECGMYEVPVNPREPAIVSYNMDAIEVEKTLRAFLHHLRQQGLLLLKDEFKKKDSSLYYSKPDQISRILGRDYIERTAERLGLKYVKAPKKIAVIDPKKDPLSFSVSGDMEIHCSDLEIYAEKIEPIQRRATPEELAELDRLLQEVQFNDRIERNVILGKNPAGQEGMYIIDTEFTNFTKKEEKKTAKEKQLVRQKWVECGFDHRTAPFTIPVAELIR